MWPVGIPFTSKAGEDIDIDLYYFSETICPPPLKAVFTITETMEIIDSDTMRMKPEIIKV
jgi:hypothetical protein